jgi:hypothetical protein
MDQDEYRRRQDFCEIIKTLGKSELIEIARILRKYNVALSENRSGLFFDMAKISPKVFEELLKFHSFVEQNNVELEKRNGKSQRAKAAV